MDRKRISEQYDSLLNGMVIRPRQQEEFEYNYAYYPVVFNCEKELLRVFTALNDKGIYPRRYFYPSLNTVSYISGNRCPVSEDIAQRIACLPLYTGLEEHSIDQINEIIKLEVL